MPAVNICAIIILKCAIRFQKTEVVLAPPYYCNNNIRNKTITDPGKCITANPLSPLQPYWCFLVSDLVNGKPATGMNNSLQIGGLTVQPPGNINKNSYGLPGRLYKLRNKNGLEATITNCGAQLISLLVTNRHGNLVDVIAAPGKSNGRHGVEGIPEVVVWDAKQLNDHIVELNYPKKNVWGNLNAKVTYFLNDYNGLKIIFEVNTDKGAVINPTDIVFFNLNGRNNGNILNHQVWIKADNYLPVDQSMAITGKMEAVANTPFDFRNSATIGSRINDHHVQLKNGNGYNHDFILNKHVTRTPVARVMGNKSDIIMEVFTDQPGLKFYSGNLVQNKINEAALNEGPHAAFAMKTRHLFDLHTQPQFIPAQLGPGHTYRSVTSYLLKNKI